MPIEIKMPQLSDTMDSGKIIAWNKQEGDAIERGEVLAEVETDKANLEIESFHKGVLLKIVTGANDTANVGEVIAYIGEAGEAIGDSPAPAPESSSAAPAPTPAPAAIEETSTPRPAAPSHSISSTNGSSSGRVKASPLAKQLAAQKNIPLHTVTGSGPQGRIVKRDIEQFGSSGASQVTTSPKPATTPRPAARPQSTPPAMSASPSSVPFSKMRDTIARRMQESVRQAPHFYVTTSIRMDEVIQLRKRLKLRPEFERLSINHFIIKATAYGITQEPRVNFAVRNDTETFNPGEINIGMITALEDGLLIPV
ncbi:MAG: 2-oxo acid dehydrogenase subunit E2, partial [Bdellovibrionales bacterium]|nr:2-oxo acid dehydrogenase subunit E2 [Bdellovibrionales bacterium]